MLDWGRFIVTRFTVMLEVPSMSMNTRVSRNEAQTRWNTRSVARMSFAEPCKRFKVVICCQQFWLSPHFHGDL
jgi:hypothetical protein